MTSTELAIEFQICEVCKRLDGDLTPKRCRYCSVCQAWICDQCAPDMVRRGRAALNRILSASTDKPVERVLEEAQSWIGTPYHKNGKQKGTAADCGTFPFMVYFNCNLLPADSIHIFDNESVVPRAQDWWANNTEERYLKAVLKFFRQTIQGMSYPRFGAEPGMLAVTKAAGSKRFNHAGIVLKWPQIYHATSDSGVHVTNASTHPMWSFRQVMIFTPFEGLKP